MIITPAFKDVFEPTVTAHAPRFADRAMMITADGEIRLYGTRFFEHEDGTKRAHYIVMKSRDGGLSFSEEPFPENHPGASVCSPWSGEYITLLTLSAESYCRADRNKISWEGETSSPMQIDFSRKPGVYVFRAPSPDGPWQGTKLMDDPLHIQHLPIPLKSRKRWICTAQRRIGDFVYPFVLWSDDDGRTWKQTRLQPPPYFDKITYPHRAFRWKLPGTEPIVAETRTGKLIMLLRSSLDVHYQCTSEDGGETWSEYTPSNFFSVATMPGLYALSDGRLLAVWNNTTPMPEINVHEQDDLLDESQKDGTWEDVFTNRDVLHAAISEDDGITWRGFREIALNPLRNSADFRTAGGGWIVNDKSVHQNQLLELPGNKVIIHYGQHVVCSRVMLMDINFLYADHRHGDFMHGLRDWSTHLYVRSLSGSAVVVGHCAWNRRSGAQLLPSPDRDSREALLIGRHPDDRLFSDLEGVAWNFPAARRGRVQADLTITPGSAGIRVSLLDRWLNPSDPHVGEYAAFSFVIDGNGCANGTQLLTPGAHGQVFMEFDLEHGTIAIHGSTGGSFTLPVTQKLPAPSGVIAQLSYLHLQTAADKEDTLGVWLHSTDMTGNL